MPDSAKHTKDANAAFAFLRKKLDDEYHQAVAQFDSVEAFMRKLGDGSLTPPVAPKAQPAAATKKKKPAAKKKPATKPKKPSPTAASAPAPTSAAT